MLKRGLYIFVFILLLFTIFNLEIKASESKLDSLLVELQISELDALEKAEVYLEIAQEYYILNDYPLALENASHSLNLYSKIKQTESTAIAKKLIGDIYSEVNDFDNSLKYYLEALIISEDFKNSLFAAQINHEIGRLFIKISEFDKALNKFNESLVFYEKDTVKYRDEIVSNYANIGITYGSVSKLDSALMYFEKAYVMYPESDYLNRGGVLNNIGAIKYKQNNYKEALEYYNRAVENFIFIEHKKGIGIAYFNIAQTQLLLENHKEAETYFENSVPYLEEAGALYYLFNCYEQLSDFNEKKGDLDKSLQYHKLFALTKDSIMNVETLNKLASLQMKYDIRKVEHKMKMLERDNQLKQIKEYILIASLVLLLVLSSLIFLNLRGKIRNTRLNQKLLSQEKVQLRIELDYKNRELENFALQIVRKNEFLTQVKTEIKEVDGDFNKLKDISININQNLYLEKDREEFHNHLEKIHESFFLRLDTNFPDLTINDKRLCSLLAIDLSTKDIATIVNISPESVKKSRYRLRKKLGIDTEDKLSEFLKNI